MTVYTISSARSALEALRNALYKCSYSASESKYGADNMHFRVHTTSAMTKVYTARLYVTVLLKQLCFGCLVRLMLS